jgi:citronellol/citronellal dehydrogenase
VTTLAGRTLLMSGGSRGIGLAIATRAAQDGASIVLLAKTAQPHSRLEGTVHTAAAQIDAAGGRALAIVGDVRNDDDVARAVAAAVDRFGGLDIVVNNASALDLRSTREIDMKRYDLMQDINARGTFLLSKAAIPHLERSTHGHVLTLSPPLDLRPKWAGAYLAYTMAGSRTPTIMADAAHAVLVRDPRTCTGHFFLDEEVLAQEGVTDLDRYRAVPGGGPLETDLFLDPLESPA